jgi:hypothetical protein
VTAVVRLGPGADASPAALASYLAGALGDADDGVFDDDEDPE